MAIIRGTAGKDTLIGTDLFDTINGDAGDDIIDGRGGNDKMAGGLGNDTFIGGAGADYMDGGAGVDTVTYASSSAGVRVFLATGNGYGGQAEGDTLISIENVIGSRFNDTITGDAGNNVIAGLGGADTIDGGEGIDTVDYSASASGVNVDLSLPADYFRGQKDGDAEGDRLTSIENLIGTSNHDYFRGSDGANKLEGRDGNDTLSGQGGDDTLIGGLGQDDLFGGEDRDTFVYLSVEDSPNVTTGPQPWQHLWDYIKGFETGVDTVNLRAIDANTTQAGDQAFTIAGVFTGRAGELVLGPVVEHATGPGPEAGSYFNQMLLADTNGDAQADFAIQFSWQDSPGVVTSLDIFL